VPNIVTAEQVRTLWDDPNPNASIDRGDEYEPVTQDTLGVLASGLDTDDDGYPLEDQWEVLADQLNTAAAGEPTSTQGETLLHEIEDARLRRAEADEQFYAAIREAVASKLAPVTAIAAAAGLSRERIYQIRDGRR
jgi:hypothetical protein